MDTRKSSDLPPGFRFHPTDEELILYYLKNQVTSRPCPVSIIPEVDIYKFEPWELPEKAEYGEKEWYFFTPRDRKYPNGARPNRATTSGYWKATGTDKAIHSGSKYVGVKKALVFYKGRPPKGLKTEWIMHEYRLGDSRRYSTKLNGSMRLDDWVLCRIYKKRHSGIITEKKEDSCIQNAMGTNVDVSDQQALIFPRSLSLAHLMEVEYLSISHLLSDNPYSESNHGMDKFPLIDEDCQFANSTKFHVNQNVQFNQQMYINPVFEFQ